MDIHMADGNWQFVRKDGQSHQLPYGMSFIGREECDITLQSHSADKRHAVIFHDSADKEVRIKDLNSATGTYVNSVRIPEQSYVKLKHLDCVRLGYGPDVFYIQKIAHTPSPVSPKKELPNSTIIGNESELKVTEVNAKCTIGSAQTPTEQDNSAANESSLSLHEADSLEDIRQPLPRHSPSTSTPLFCEKGIPVGHSLPSMYGKEILPIDKEDGLVISEATRNQASKRSDSVESAKQDNSPKTNEVKDLLNLQVKDTSLRMQTDHLCNNTNLEEKSADSNAESEKVDNSESSPAAMAFTIAFDNDIPMPRKKLAIKDSISKYAPRKSEPERAPPQKTRIIKANEANLKKAHSSDNKDVNPPKVETSRKWIPEDVKQQQHSVMTRPPETTIWDLATKVEHKGRSSPEGKLSDAATFLIQKMLNGEPKPFATQVTETIESSSPRMTNWSHSWNNNNKNQMDGITKSFNKTSAGDQRLKSPENGPHVQKEIDDKSETGTYTVDTDQNDPAVEEARQKIDEIFGVQKTIVDKTGALTGSNFSWNDRGREKQVLSLNEQNKLVSKQGSSSIKHQGSDGSSSEGNSPRMKTDRNPSRPKRRLPTPPIPKQLDASISDGHVSSDSRVSARLEHFPLSLAKKDKGQRTAHGSNQDISQQHRPRQYSAPITSTTIHVTPDNVCDRRARFSENIRSQKVPPVGNKPGLVPLSITTNTSHRSLDSNDSQAWSHTAQHDSCQNGDDDSLDGTTLSQYTPSDTRSEGSPQAKTPQSSSLWRRIPWNLSSSDLELNRSKSETASVVSDLSTSTEPSSLSSQYSKGKSDSAPPPMRLNRAFALRRARLGIESDSAATVIKKAGSKENIRQQSATSGKASNLNPTQLSRQDGGRFSLRLPRKVMPKQDDKSGTKSSASKKNRNALNKGGHRRIDSDPGKTNLNWSQIDIINDTINSDIEVSQIPVISSSSNNLQTFHRSASFDGTEELLCAKDNVDSSVQKRAGRPTQLLKASGISKLRKCGGLESARALGISPGWQHSSMEEKESEKIVPQQKGSPQQSSTFTKRELSALDSLVISAIHQLSIKLRTGARCLLEKERQNHAESSDRRLMIEEVLPQIVEKKSSTHTEGNLTRDLSSILKNLKRVEQSLEVLSSLADYDSEAKNEPSQVETRKFFVVNV